MAFKSNPAEIANDMDEDGEHEQPLRRRGVKAATAAPAAPPRRKTSPAPAPSPTAPPRKKKDPFHVPRPAVVPRPQNEFFLLMEGYEEEAHPNNQRFWNGMAANKNHAFGKHPIFAVYGNKLSKGAFEHTSARAARVNAQPHQMMRIFQQIMSVEARHASILTELAKDIVAQIWNFPKERLDAMLTTDIEVNNTGEDEGGEEPNLGEQPAAAEAPDAASAVNLTKEINKRLTLNALGHGSSVHNMMEIHHLVRDKLQQLDPRLIALYDQIASASHKQYWLFDISAMLEQLANQAAGSARVDWGEDGEDQGEMHEEDQQGGAKVVARGVCFPVLVQELCKGIMMLLNAHGLQGHDENTTKQILNGADDIKHEPWLIQVGPELWRRFMKVMNQVKAPHAQTLAALAQKSPDEVHDIIMQVLDGKETAAQLIQQLGADEVDEPGYEDQGYQDTGTGGDEPIDDDEGEEWKNA